MIYTEVQIRQADAALKVLHGKSGFTHGHELWQVMSREGKDANAMRSKMVNELGIISRQGDNFQITEAGEKAYEMGFKAWLEERERMKSEPIPTRIVEGSKPWWKLTKEGWISLATLITTIVFGISNCRG